MVVTDGVAEKETMRFAINLRHLRGECLGTAVR